MAPSVLIEVIFIEFNFAAHEGGSSGECDGAPVCLTESLFEFYWFPRKLVDGSFWPKIGRRDRLAFQTRGILTCKSK